MAFLWMAAWPVSMFFVDSEEFDVDVTWQGVALILLIHVVVICVAIFLL